MKLFSMIVMAATLVTASACEAQSGSNRDNREVEGPSQSGASTSDSILERLVDPELVGGNLAYFESISGPPKRIHETTRYYRPGDCYVEVEADGQTITAITYVVSTNCNPEGFGLRFFGASLADAERQLGSGEYVAGCLRMCGNAVEPTHSLIVPGYRANGYKSFNIEAMPSQESEYNPIQSWEDSLVAKYGEDYVAYEMGYMCNPEDAAGARDALQNLPVMRVTLSLSDASLPCRRT